MLPSAKRSAICAAASTAKRVFPMPPGPSTVTSRHAGSVSTLCQAVVRRTRYPRRDAMVLMQGDFTDQPEHLPELVKRFEGGADLVVGERSHAAFVPKPARMLRRIAPWVLRPFIAVPGVSDPFSSFRLVRIAVVRDLLREPGEGPPVTRDGWAGNVELLLGLARHARRTETVELAPRWDVRPRATRVRPWSDAIALYRFRRAPRTARPRSQAARRAAIFRASTCSERRRARSRCCALR